MKLVCFLFQANRDKTTDHVYESKQKLKEKEKKNFHGMLLSKINIAVQL
jgi:hypothetical protein